MRKKKTTFSAQQIAWAENMVINTEEIWEWEIPANGCVYQFNRLSKEIHLISGDITKDNWHELNTQLFAKIGWKVLDRRKENKTFKIDQLHGQGKTWN